MSLAAPRPVPFPARARRLPRGVRPYWAALAPKLVETGWLSDPLLEFGLTHLCTLYWAYRVARRIERAWPRDPEARAMAAEARRLVRDTAARWYLIPFDRVALGPLDRQGDDIELHRIFTAGRRLRLHGATPPRPPRRSA